MMPDGSQFPTATQNKTCAMAGECDKGENSTELGPRLDQAPCDSHGGESGAEIKRGRGGARSGAGRPPNPPDYIPPPRVRRSIAPAILYRAALGARWHVVETLPRAEIRTMRDLARGETRPGFPARPGYVTELPLTAEVEVTSKARIMRAVPMWPGYGFVQFDCDADNWPEVKDCDGVRRVFAVPGTLRPWPLPVGFVEKLIEDAPERLRLKQSRTWQPGQELVVIDGPFARFQAVCVTCDGLTTAASVYIFGRETLVKLPARYFEAA